MENAVFIIHLAEKSIDADIIIKSIQPKDIEKYAQQENLTMDDYAIIEGKLIKSFDEAVGFMSIR